MRYISTGRQCQGFPLPARLAGSSPGDHQLVIGPCKVVCSACHIVDPGGCLALSPSLKPPTQLSCACKLLCSRSFPCSSQTLWVVVQACQQHSRGATNHSAPSSTICSTFFAHQTAGGVSTCCTESALIWRHTALAHACKTRAKGQLLHLVMWCFQADIQLLVTCLGCPLVERLALIT